jgi:mono/diheme cytochrome c family protein
VITRVFCYGMFAGLILVSSAMAQDTPRGNVANGKRLFETIGCFDCHGGAGQGGAAQP